MRRTTAMVFTVFTLLWGVSTFYINSIYSNVVASKLKPISTVSIENSYTEIEQQLTFDLSGGPNSEQDIEVEARNEVKNTEQAQVTPQPQPQTVQEDIRYKSAGVDPTTIGLPAEKSSEGEKFKSNLESLLNMAKRTEKDTFTLASRSGSQVNGRLSLTKVVNEDSNYVGVKVELSESDRDLVERIVTGEAGAEDFTGKALVAQAIRDAMVTDDLTVQEVWENFKYTPRIDRTPDNEVKQAVSFIFNGGYVVKHRVLYFYAPALVNSEWHETQKFVIEHGGHRFFDRRD